MAAVVPEAAAASPAVPLSPQLPEMTVLRVRSKFIILALTQTGLPPPVCPWLTTSIW